MAEKKKATGAKKAPDAPKAPSSEGAGTKEASEQLRRIKVADLLVQAVSGLVSLGFVRLAGDQLDLAQARLAIDSLKALEPVLREQVAPELADELSRAIASLQLNYAEAASKPAEEKS